MSFAQLVVFSVSATACAAPIRAPECGAAEPFAKVATVVPLRTQRPGFPAHVPHWSLVGARLTLVDAEGLDVEAWQRRVDCRLARADSPFPPGVEARVSIEAALPVVELRANSLSSARAVLAQAQHLTTGETP